LLNPSLSFRNQWLNLPQFPVKMLLFRRPSKNLPRRLRLRPLLSTLLQPRLLSLLKRYQQLRSKILFQ